MLILIAIGSFLMVLPLLFAVLSGNAFVLVGAGIGIVVGTLPAALLVVLVSPERFQKRQSERSTKQGGAIIGIAAAAGAVLSPFIPFSKLPPLLLWGAMAAGGALLVSFALAMYFKFDRVND